jgi:hypothetical protein
LASLLASAVRLWWWVVSVWSLQPKPSQASSPGVTTLSDFFENMLIDISMNRKKPNEQTQKHKEIYEQKKSSPPFLPSQA